MKKTFIFVILSIILAVSATAQQDTAYQLRKVLIDAGHGGKDPGAIGKVAKEKNLTLAIALKLGHYIDSLIPGVDVQYTRTTDIFLSLKERAEMTNKIMPDVFISIHINSCKNKKINGYTTYVNGYSKDKDNLEIQKKENGGEDISDDAIIEMTNLQHNNHEYSELLAAKIQKQFSSTQWFKNQKTHDLGTKHATFAVLWRAYMPAVLVECGYISNQEEERFLNSQLGQVNIASAIFRAFRDYKNELETSGNKEVQTQPATLPATKTETQTTQPVAKTETKPAPSGNTSAKTDNKIYFRVQIKSNPKKIPLNSKEFKGLKNIDEILIDGVYKYTIGKTQNYQEILKKQAEVRKTIKDAFVIATKGDKKIEIKDARKELGQ
ncbi:MAG: N-acetylmuramoyl-L-alanine amidase [Bacteroidales bacterium]|nr:N-acetylmuramoyl-L-alanine amidase [Bacteroidales bacterium]